MQEFKDMKILLGICGGIAAYKSANLLRDLKRKGADVRVVMTHAALEFIKPLTLQALSGHEVRTELFDASQENAMDHIELARWADFILIAPATANLLAKLAHGIADDLLSTLYLVAENQVIFCPAMNKSMWSHPATINNCKLLAERGDLFIGPDEGLQACGEFGFGRMSEVDKIISSLSFYNTPKSLEGKKILITAGPTREAIDPVRYISNQSSGKMGYALAEAAVRAGAMVTLISGPTALTPPKNLKFIEVISAEYMYQQVLAELQDDMVFIGAAAVADYRLESIADNKLKKQDNSSLTLNLIKNPDIIAAVANSRKASLVVGFAAETENLIDNALTKLNEKNVDMIIANQVGNGLGFDSDFNKVTVLTKNSQTELSFDHKIKLAEDLIAIIATSLQNKAHMTNKTTLLDVGSHG